MAGTGQPPDRPVPDTGSAESSGGAPAAGAGAGVAGAAQAAVAAAPTQAVADAERIEAAVAAEAARVLRAGGLVALPTETVYGLAADAEQQGAVARIYAVKGRPAGHPLIVHVTDSGQARWWAEWPSDAQRLAGRFWPGPLTLVLPRRAGVPAWACGQEPTIGLRCPSHPVARAVLAAFTALGGHGVAAPSANRFGRISPTRAQHVIDDLGPDAALVVDGGASEVGLESTIVDLSRGEPVLLRPGAVTAAQIADALGRPVQVSAAVTDPGRIDPQAPRVPGALPSHYAPRTATRLVAAEALPEELARLTADGRRVALLLRASTPLPAMSPAAPPAASPQESLSVPPSVPPSTLPPASVPASGPRPGDGGIVVRRPSDDSADTFARELYSLLRELDAAGCDLLLVQMPPADDDWQAIRDRLTRAAHR